MRRSALALALGAALTLSACGKDDSYERPTGTNGASSTTAHPATTPALAGAAWDGGEPPDLTGPSEKIRVVAFFKPT